MGFYSGKRGDFYRVDVLDDYFDKDVHPTPIARLDIPMCSRKDLQAAPYAAVICTIHPNIVVKTLDRADRFSCLIRVVVTVLGRYRCGAFQCRPQGQC
jgi:hypothetical protein